MNKAFLYGYYGMHNTGDNALLLASAWGTKKYLSTDSFTINSSSDFKLPLIGKIQQLIREQQNFPGENRLYQYHAALSSQNLVFGGGSILHCARDINHMNHLCNLSQGHALALGVGLGPFKNRAAETACKKFLNNCDFIGLRDEESFAIAQSLAPESNSALTFDLAPLLLNISSALSPSYIGTKQTLSATYTTEVKHRRGIAVALCPIERLENNFAAETYRLKALARSLSLVHALTGEPIYLFDFNAHQTLGDSAVHQQLKRLMPSNIPVIYYYYQSNPLLLIEKFRHMRAVIAMRLHAAVFSYLADTPCMSLSYHNKCEGWNKQIGAAKSYCFDAYDIDELRLQKSLLDGLNDGFTKPTLSRQDAVQKSLLNFELVAAKEEALLCVNH